jgi:hypothetical protein
MEEVAQFIITRGGKYPLENEFYYCFMTKLNDEDEEEDWEGTVGQLKKTIEDATSILETNLKNSVETMTKQNTEKIIDSLLKANKQELDVIDMIQKCLEKESNSIKVAFNEQLLNESQKTKDQFTHTLQRLEADAKRTEQEFQRTHERLDHRQTTGQRLGQRHDIWSHPQRLICP